MDKRVTMEQIVQKKYLLPYQLPQVENALGLAFHPVEPRPDFVSTLKTQFNDPESIRPFRNLSSSYVMLVILTLISIMILLITGIKLIFDLFSIHRKT